MLRLSGGFRDRCVGCASAWRFDFQRGSGDPESADSRPCRIPAPGHLLTFTVTAWATALDCLQPFGLCGSMFATAHRCRPGLSGERPVETETCHMQEPCGWPPSRAGAPGPPRAAAHAVVRRTASESSKLGRTRPGRLHARGRSIQWPGQDFEATMSWITS
jgi:hypothetical protein